MGSHSAEALLQQLSELERENRSKEVEIARLTSQLELLQHKAAERTSQ
jgi:hypothetical protein